MIWEAFCVEGTLTLAFPSTRMNSQQYTKFLDTHFIPFHREKNEVDWTFQQDNEQSIQVNSPNCEYMSMLLSS